MQTAKEFFKKHKIVFTAGLVFLVGLLILILTNSSGTPVRPPVINEPDNVFDTRKFKLESVTPKEGPHSTMDSFEYIKFTFSQPIDLAKVVVSVIPPVKLEKDVFENKNILVIRPDKDYWKEETEYKITISNVVSLEGEELGSDITYTYFNSPPTDIKTGESGLN